MEKPSLPKGTRDFGPMQMARRLFILDHIRSVFRTYGFQPLETPAMENLSTLTGKYGEEGDQLLFRILNSGDFLKSADPADLAGGQTKAVAAQICEKGLRYDLTVPFARYVVMNQHEITLPFRRFQIQPVWRADRPQKGRYREFYQCDADVVGTDSLLCETEIVLMIREVFQRLGIQAYRIKINHRDLLSGLASLAGAAGKEASFFVALDKLDKIGEAKVREEMALQGIAGSGLDQVFGWMKTERSASEKIDMLRPHLTDTGSRGLSELQEVLDRLEQGDQGLEHVELDLSLARGLSYYTGCIFEVKVDGASVGSVSGGGRYDNLTQAFGAKEKLSGVGISFGIDRLYDVMDELQLFPEAASAGTRVVICHFDRTTLEYGFGVLRRLRASGIAAEIYPDIAKLKKQLEFANRKNIAHAIIIGEEEMTTGMLTIKDLNAGTQLKTTLSDILQQLA